MKKIKLHYILFIIGTGFIIISAACFLSGKELKAKKDGVVEELPRETYRKTLVINIENKPYLYGEIFREYTSGYAMDDKIIEELGLKEKDWKDMLGTQIDAVAQGNLFYRIKGRQSSDYLFMCDNHTGTITLWKWVQGVDGQSMEDIWGILGIASPQDIAQVIVYPTFYEEKAGEVTEVEKVQLTLEQKNQLYEQLVKCTGKKFDFSDEDFDDEFQGYRDVMITTKNGFKMELTYNIKQACFFQNNSELDDAEGICYNTVDSEFAEWFQNVYPLTDASSDGKFHRTKDKEYFDILQEILVKDYSDTELQKCLDELSKNIDKKEENHLSQCYDSIQILKDKRCILVLLKEEYKDNEEIKSAIKKLTSKPDMIVIG